MSARLRFRNDLTATRQRVRGFTLTEAILVIVITGILASMVAVFIQKPVQGFFDAARRAALVDAADTALRRLSRDLHDALPNSVRVSGTAIEFLHVRSAGRYRQDLPYGGASGDLLDFSAADTSFDVLGPPVEVQSGDSIVVYNLGIAGATAYDAPTASTSTRRGAVTNFGTAVANVNIASTLAFPGSSPAKRFQVVDMPISYVCAGTQLRRYAGYTITPSQTVPPAGSGDLVADKIATGGCTFAYAAGASQRDSLVTIRLNLTDGVESVGLLYQVHVNNVP
jgi:MSHA biogenesis protein MshO